MSTISPSLQIGGVNGWKSKEGAVLGWQQTSGNLFKPAKFDFTRLSGSASYVDENGLIQIEHRPNYPRFTWQDGKQSLMNEEARTNLISDNATPANWYNTVLTPTNEGAFELNGSGVSFEWGKYTQSGTVNNFALLNSSIAGGTDFAISLYVKISESGDYIGVRETGVGIGVVQISTETVVTAACLTDVRVLDTANADIKRVIIKGTKGGSGTLFLQLPSSTGNSLADDGNTIQLTAFQLEEGTYESSVIPTSGSAVTRAAESIEGLNLGNFLGDSQGGLYLDGLFSDAEPQAIGINGGAATESVLLEVSGVSSARFRVLNSGTQCDISGSSISANTFYKMFGAYATNDFAFYFDGTQIGTDSSGSTFSDGTLTQLETQSGSGSLLSRGLIHEIKVYDQRPTNAQLESDTL